MLRGELIQQYSRAMLQGQGYVCDLRLAPNGQTPGGEQPPKANNPWSTPPDAVLEPVWRLQGHQHIKAFLAYGTPPAVSLQPRGAPGLILAQARA